jgi:hypothetical protein
MSEFEQMKHLEKIEKTLKPCPFCTGTNLGICPEEDASGNSNWHIWCRDCNTQAAYMVSSPEDTAKEWNQAPRPADDIVMLRGRVRDMKQWIIACRDEILMPLSHTEGTWGILAEGLGQQTVKLLEEGDVKNEGVAT